ncbi:alpha/beta hydrolase [uncultured Umboniibacter sp.]|uniref:alpha/beta fold hydrolase n=1 Tax=uncultured Umboniibacter sp. TaxID=1798917 RepID=UPI002626148B|nr:alpha/beta hydrolase [uncultured Umboniibacter sp.]
MTNNDITLFHELIGDPAKPVMVLVQGLGLPSLSWHRELVDSIIAAGFSVLLLDNRDCGLSTILHHHGSPNVAKMIMRKLFGLSAGSSSYTLADMADDVVRCCDVHGIKQFHVAGVSMGGMIAQTVAINYPQRVLSLCSIMSTTGERRYSVPKSAVRKAVIAPQPKDREGRIEQALKFWQVIGSPAFPTDDALLRQRLVANYDRGFYPEGTMRQLAAIIASPPRYKGLQQTSVPGLVIHGDCDLLVPLKGGLRTAKALGVKPIVIKGMGHDLPMQLLDRFAELMTTHAFQAEDNRTD